VVNGVIDRDFRRGSTRITGASKKNQDFFRSRRARSPRIDCGEPPWRRNGGRVRKVTDKKCANLPLAGSLRSFRRIRFQNSNRRVAPRRTSFEHPRPQTVARRERWLAPLFFPNFFAIDPRIPHGAAGRIAPGKHQASRLGQLLAAPPRAREPRHGEPKTRSNAEKNV
jgi:hypothetical protein